MKRLQPPAGYSSVEPSWTGCLHLGCSPRIRDETPEEDVKTLGPPTSTSGDHRVNPNSADAQDEARGAYFRTNYIIDNR